MSALRQNLQNGHNGAEASPGENSVYSVNISACGAQRSARPTFARDIKEVARFFGFKLRKMKRIVRESGVKPWRVGGEDRFAEEHVVQLGGQAKPAPDETCLRQAWREFCGLPAVSPSELGPLVLKINSLLDVINHYEQLCQDLRCVTIPRLEERIRVLEKRRYPMIHRGDAETQSEHKEAA